MSLLSRLESRFGRWAIPNLTVLLIAGQVLLYVLSNSVRAAGGGVDPLGLFYLEPAQIVQGQIWRMVSFAFLPPNTNLLFAFIGWYLLYLFGSTLEHFWGTFRFNCFLLIGLVANVLAAFVAWLVWGLPFPILPGTVMMATSAAASNALLYGSIVLAFARICPDFVLNMFFVLPIRIKWLALLAWIGYGYGFLRGPNVARVLIIAGVLNYLIFFGRDHLREWKQGKRRREFQSRVKSAAQPIQHECLVCGINNENSPKTLFRYCSKCDGQCCYCPEHIHDHQHVTADEKQPT